MTQYYIQRHCQAVQTVETYVTKLRWFENCGKREKTLETDKKRPRPWIYHTDRLKTSRATQTKDSVTGRNDLIGPQAVMFHPSAPSGPKTLPALKYMPRHRSENPERNELPYLKRVPSTISLSAVRSLASNVADSRCEADWRRPPDFAKMVETQTGKWFWTGLNHPPPSPANAAVGEDTLFGFQKVTAQHAVMRQKPHGFQLVDFCNQRRASPSKIILRRPLKLNLHENGPWVTKARKFHVVGPSRACQRLTQSKSILPVHAVQQPTKIPSRVLRIVNGRYQGEILSTPKNPQKPEEILFATASNPQDAQRKVLYNCKPLGTSGEGQHSTSDKPDGIPVDFQYSAPDKAHVVSDEMKMFSSAKESKGIQEKVMLTTASELQHIAREGQYAIFNEPQQTATDGQYDKYNEPQGTAREDRYATFSEAQHTARGQYATFNEPPGTREDRYATFNEPRQTAREPRQTARESQYATCNEPQGTAREDKYALFNEPQGIAGEEKYATFNEPQDTAREDKYAIFNEPQSCAREGQYDTVIEPAGKLCNSQCATDKKLVVAREDQYIAANEPRSNLEDVPVTETSEQRGGTQRQSWCSETDKTQNIPDEVHCLTSKKLRGTPRPGTDPCSSPEEVHCFTSGQLLYESGTDQHANETQSRQGEGQCTVTNQSAGTFEDVLCTKANHTQETDMSPIDLSRTLSPTEENPKISCIRTNSGQGLVPQEEGDPVVNCPLPEKTKPQLQDPHNHQNTNIIYESTMELSQNLEDAEETRTITMKNDTVVQQEHFPICRALPALGQSTDVRGTKVTFQRKCKICKAEDDTVSHEGMIADNFNHTETKTERGHVYSDHGCVGDDEKVTTDDSNLYLINQSHSGSECKPQNVTVVKISPFRIVSDSDKSSILFSQDQSDVAGEDKHESQPDSLLDDNVNDNTRIVLPNSSMRSSFWENNGFIASPTRLNKLKCTDGREFVQEAPKDAKYPHDSQYSDLKILETVSLAGEVPSEESSFSHTNSSGGFYCCGCQGGGCSFISQLQSDFASHLRDAHPMERTYPCVHCGSRESSPSLLLYHLDHHLDFHRFSLYCTQPDCDFHSFSPDEVVYHMASYHPNHTTHICWCCSQWLGTLQQLKLHIEQNLLHITLCPHCDAKDTDPQRLLQHITTAHPDKGRMVVFHKLLMCGERKTCGRKEANAFSQTPLPAFTSADCGEVGNVMTDYAVSASSTANKFETDMAVEMTCVSEGHNCSDGNLQHPTGLSNGDETMTELNLAVNDKGPCHYQKATGKSETHNLDLYHSSVQSSRQLKAETQDPDSQFPGEETETSTEDEGLPETDNECEKVNSTKLIFVRNGVHFECLDKSTRILSDKEKLSMEPMDLEISVDGSVDLSQGRSDCEEERPLTCSESKRTVSPSTTSTFPPEIPEQSKFYKCTVVSAGRSIKLVSSKSGNNQHDHDHDGACGIKAARKVRKRRLGSRDATRKAASSRRQESKLYSCRLCSFTSHLSRGIYQHMYSRHGHIVDCPQCGQRCKTRTALFNHLMRCHPDDARTVFNNHKLTKWIRITPTGDRKVTKRTNQTTTSTVLSSLNEQDYPVKNYFVVASHGKDRSIHCVLCDYSFKKYHRSNANIYRSMYKHMFLRHIPHEFQCPTCHYTDDREDRTRKHMKEEHGDCEQEPDILVLSQRPAHHASRSFGMGSSGSAVRQSRRVKKRKMEALKDFVVDFSP